MKRAILVCFVLAAVMMTGCASMGTAVPPPSDTAREYRELQEDLRQQQADIAVTGQKVEHQSRDIVENLTRLEESIAGASPDFGEAERVYWLSQAQAVRIEAGNHQAEIESLNRQLAEERKTAGEKDRKFNDYESEVTRDLSDRDTEISQLRVENKAVKGQRNTFLAILITAGVVVVLFAGIKFLRFMKIIPF
jgi:uncharacterized protein YhaN